MEDNILSRMLQRYGDFTRSQRKIVDYVVRHRRKVEHITITELSKQCGVSVSTVSLFCKKIKVRGFHAFKLELVRAASTDETCLESLTEELGNDSAAVTMNKAFQQMSAELNNIYHKLSESAVISAAGLLQNARQVICLGQGNDSIVALAAWAQFSTISSKFKAIQDSYMQIVSLSTLSEEDVVLYFSNSKFGEEILASAEIIRRQGAKLILVTEHLNPLVETYVDVVLLYELIENPCSLCLTSVIVVQLFVVEMLLSKFIYYLPRLAEQNRSSVQKALEQKYV